MVPGLLDTQDSPVPDVLKARLCCCAILESECSRVFEKWKGRERKSEAPPEIRRGPV